MSIARLASCARHVPPINRVFSASSPHVPGTGSSQPHPAVMRPWDKPAKSKPRLRHSELVRALRHAASAEESEKFTAAFHGPRLWSDSSRRASALWCYFALIRAIGESTQLFREGTKVCLR